MLWQAEDFGRLMRQKVPTLRAYFHELLTPAVRALAWITLWGARMWLWVFTVFACIVQFDSLVSVDEQQKDGDSESTSGSAAVGMPSGDPIDTDLHDNANTAQPGVQQNEACEAREGASRHGNRMVIGALPLSVRLAFWLTNLPCVSNHKNTACATSTRNPPASPYTARLQVLGARSLRRHVPSLCTRATARRTQLALALCRLHPRRAGQHGLPRPAGLRRLLRGLAHEAAALCRPCVRQRVRLRPRRPLRVLGRVATLRAAALLARGRGGAQAPRADGAADLVRRGARRVAHCLRSRRVQLLVR